MINSKIFQEKISLNSLKKFHSFSPFLPTHRKNPADKKHSSQRIQPSPYSVVPIVAFCEWTRANEGHTSTRKPSEQNTQHSDNNHFRNLISFLVYLKYTLNFRKSQEKYFLDDTRLNFLWNLSQSSGLLRLNFLWKISQFFFGGKEKGGSPPFYV